MKICLLGYGKMGQAIEKQLLQRGHEISGKVGRVDQNQLESVLVQSDMAIEFSAPHAVVNHLLTCFKLNIPVVCGTTGWLEQWTSVEQHLAHSNAALLYASNFSIGVQLFFELNKKLAHLMKSRNEYQCSLHEVHHTHKKDAPSGTAISLVNDILAEIPRYQTWSLSPSDDQTALYIHSERIDPVVGTHEICYQSEIDRIDICHTAHSRDGFALGAVLAAEYLIGKKGNYSMQDVLGINSKSN